jgi:hypothetical protein
MSTLSARSFQVILGAVAACAISLPALGGGSDCHERATRMDVEGDTDGQISAAAHAAGAQKRFEMVDANHDGKLTATEIGASHGAESVAWAKHPMSAADKIREFDTNGDGVVTPAEYAAGSQKMFDKLDVDGDGHLGAAELRVDPKNGMTAHDSN